MLSEAQGRKTCDLFEEFRSQGGGETFSSHHGTGFNSFGLRPLIKGYLWQNYQ